MSQKTLAVKVGTDAGSVSRWEQNGGGILLDNFSKLAEALKLTPDQLLKRIGVPEGENGRPARRRIVVLLEDADYERLSVYAARRPVGEVARDLLLDALRAKLPSADAATPHRKSDPTPQGK